MIHAFGTCELDLALFQLRVGGAAVKLEPKVFDVLVHLLAHRDRVVTKDELLDAVWSGESVSESVLPHAIAAARRAVGDDRSAQGVIQTVHGRGYRFVASVTTRTAAQATAPGTAASPPVAAHGFVGRERALATLRAGLEDALAGRGRTLLLTGEPGIGKTRTAEVLAEEAQARGALVLFGRCLETEGAPAFWPWTQVLRGFEREASVRALIEELVAASEDAARLVLATRTPGAALAEGADARFRVFDVAADLLRRVAARRPLVVVLDDLHWADASSLRLLEFATPALRDARLLLLGTYRDVAVRRGHPLGRLLGALAREPGCERIALRGLDVGEVARLAEAIGGARVSPAVAAAVHEMTEGNPFFARETLRLLAEAGPLDAPPSTLRLPQSVRDAIGRRLDALSPRCTEALRAAAVLGREFELRLLAATLDVEPGALLAPLAEAVAAGVVLETDASRGRYAFVHALVHQTLYEELSTPDRVERHRRAGVALEALSAADAEPPLGELAHHFYEAAQAGEAERAVAYATRAAERASRILGWEEAARHYERALDAEGFLAPPEPGRRCGLLLALGEMRGAGGERDAARAVFADAARLARRSGDAEALARAAIGYKGLVEMGTDDGALELLEEALAAVGPDRPVWRARLLARLVGTPPHADSMETRDALSREALALAQRADDGVALGDAWNARYWACLGPDHPDERLAVAGELLALSARTGERRLEVFAHEAAFGVHLLRGERAAAEAELGAWVEAARSLRQPSYRFLAEMSLGSWAATLGDFDAAERLFAAALEHGRRTVPFAAFVHAGQIAMLRYVRGDDRMLQDAGGLLEGLDAFPAYRAVGRCGRGLAFALRGERAAAQRALDALPLRSLPRDEHWLLTMGMATDLAVAVEDQGRAAEIHDLLLPYGDLMLTHDLLRVANVAVGSALGGLCRLLGRFDEGEAWFERAIAKCTALGSPRGVLGARASLLRLLLTRGRPADRRRAAALERVVRAETAALGMDIAQAQPWLAAARPSSP